MKKYLPLFLLILVIIVLTPVIIGSVYAQETTEATISKLDCNKLIWYQKIWCNITSPKANEAPGQQYKTDTQLREEKQKGTPAAPAEAQTGQTASPYSSTVDRVCKETANSDTCNRDSQKCLGYITNVNSPEDMSQAEANFQDCLNQVKNSTNMTAAKNVAEFLKGEYGTWVGNYCAAVWKAYHPNDLDNNNGARCENAVRSIQFKGVNGCQNLPPSATGGDLESCIRTAAESVFNSPSAAQPPAPAGGAPGGGAVSRSAPVVGTPPTQPAPAPAATPATQPAPAQDTTGGQSGQQSNTEAIQIKAIIEGSENIGELPATTQEINIAGKVFKKSDPSEECIIDDVKLDFYQTAENGLVLNPPKQIVSTLNPNCQPFKVTLRGSGTYQLNVTYDNKTVYNNQVISQQSFTKTAQVAQVAKPVEVFQCEVHKKPLVSGNTISTTVSMKNDNGNYLGYDRAAWYIKKGVPTGSDKLYDENDKGKNKYGDNCQFGGKGEGCTNATGNDPTTFKDLEENQDYFIQAVAYPKDGSKKDVPCTFVGPIRTSSKQSSLNKKSTLAKANNTQVLAITSGDLANATITLGLAVSSDGISSVVIKSIGYDGQPVDTLYENPAVVGDQVITYTVSNLAKVNKVEAVVIPITQTGERLESKTYITDLPDLTKVAANPVKVQFVELSQNPNETSFTKDFIKDNPITLMAVINLPVENPVFINTENNERFTPEAQDISNKCSPTNEEKCVYQIHIGGELVKEGNYSFKFASGNQPFEGKPVKFTISNTDPATQPAPVTDGGGGDKVISKVTLSKDDGTLEQVVYPLDQSTNQGYADFDLAEGVNGLKYTVYYSDNSAPKEFPFVVERTATPTTEAPTVTNEYPECGGCNQDPNILYKTKQMSDGSYNCEEVVEDCSAEGKSCSNQQCVSRTEESGNNNSGQNTDGSESQTGEYCGNVGDYDRVCIGDDGTYKFRQCKDGNTWSGWLGSETNPDQTCRNE